MIFFRKNKPYIGEFLSSAFVGFFGLGLILLSAVTNILSTPILLPFLFGLIFAAAFLIFSPFGGVHMSPNITLAMVLYKNFDKKLLLPYTVCQVLGWGSGAGLLFLIFDRQHTALAVAGTNPALLYTCFYPPGHWLSAGLLEAVMAFFLCFVLLVLLDDRFKGKISRVTIPAALGAVILFDIIIGGSYTGACINWARDIGPRLAGWIYGSIKGYDTSALWKSGQWLVYLIASFSGTEAAGIVYRRIFCKTAAPGSH